MTLSNLRAVLQGYCKLSRQGYGLKDTSNILNLSESFIEYIELIEIVFEQCFGIIDFGLKSIVIIVFEKEKDY